MVALLALLLAAPAAIQHTPLARVPPGKPVLVRAQIESVSPAFTPQVYVRPEGARYHGYPMEERGAHHFIARIPASVIHGAAFEYFIEARLADDSVAHAGTAQQPIHVLIDAAAPLDPELAEEEARAAAEQARQKEQEERQALEKARAEAAQAEKEGKPLPPSGPGRLRVRSEPSGARVLVDGTPRGATPCEIDPISAGPHKVALQAKGHREVEANIVIPPGGDYALHLELPGHAGASAPPRLTVTSDPDGAILSVGGHEVGLTPWTGEVAPGELRLYLSAEGYKPEERKLEAAPDRDISTSVRLERLPGPAHLHIDADPPGARILVDGAQVGSAPTSLDVPPGEHEVTAEAAGLRSVAQSVMLLPGESLSLRLALVPASPSAKPPLLAVSTEPVGASVFVDGKEVGKTPFKESVAPGPHELKLSLDGYRPRGTRLSVPDRHEYELRLVVSLKPDHPVEHDEPPDPVEQARAELARANSCYKQGDFACALDGYRRAYQIKPVPNLLYNIAQARRRLKDYAVAAEGYRAFLRDAPADSPARPEAERLAALCDLLAKARTPPPAVAEDTTPPSIDHTPPTEAVRGTPLALTARIADPSGISVAQVCFRNELHPEWRCAPLERHGGDRYQAELPKGMVSDGLSYYLEAWDNAGNGPARDGSAQAPHTVAVADERDDLPALRPAAAARPAPALPPVPDAALLQAKHDELRRHRIFALATGGAAVASAGAAVACALAARSSENNAASASRATLADADRDLAQRESTGANVFYGLAAALGAVALTAFVFSF